MTPPFQTGAVHQVTKGDLTHLDAGSGAARARGKATRKETIVFAESAVRQQASLLAHLDAGSKAARTRGEATPKQKCLRREGGATGNQRRPAAPGCRQQSRPHPWRSHTGTKLFRKGGGATGHQRRLLHLDAGSEAARTRGRATLQVIMTLAEMRAHTRAPSMRQLTESQSARGT